jgi:tRNA pseudouridine55 synthase
LNSGKTYRVLVQLGELTPSGDGETEVIERAPVPPLTGAGVDATLAQFLGNQQQIPPMHSALKFEGKRLYELARKGESVERPPRDIVIHKIARVSTEAGLATNQLEFDVYCSKGTYIRTLAHDIGEVLGCGAHVVELRRLGVGGLDVTQAVTLTELEALATAPERAGKLLPLDAMLSGYPDVHLTALAAHYLRQGQPVSLQHGREPGWVRLYEGETRFLGIGQVMDDGRVAPRRLLGAGKA